MRTGGQPESFPPSGRGLDARTRASWVGWHTTLFGCMLCRLVCTRQHITLRSVLQFALHSFCACRTTRRTLSLIGGCSSSPSAPHRLCGPPSPTTTPWTTTRAWWRARRSWWARWPRRCCAGSGSRQVGAGRLGGGVAARPCCVPVPRNRPQAGAAASRTMQQAVQVHGGGHRGPAGAAPARLPACPRAPHPPARAPLCPAPHPSRAVQQSAASCNAPRPPAHHRSRRPRTPWQFHLAALSAPCTHACATLPRCWH